MSNSIVDELGELDKTNKDHKFKLSIVKQSIDPSSEIKPKCCCDQMLKTAFDLGMKEGIRVGANRIAELIISRQWIWHSLDMNDAKAIANEIREYIKHQAESTF